MLQVFFLLFAVHYQQPVPIEGQVAKIVAKKVCISFFVGIGMGNVFG